MNLAFLGLGAMGARMATRLIDAGHDVTLWNRSPEKAAPLVARGARLAESPRAAAEGASVVISMLYDDAASARVWCDPETGALAGLGQGALGVECSTVTPAWSRELSDRAAAKGCTVIDAPVAGTLPVVEKGELIFLLGGTADAAEHARPALEPMAKEILHVGPAGSGALAKLVVNGMLAAQEAALAELLAMVGHAGGDRQAAFDALCATPIASGMVKTYGQIMLDGTGTVNFPVSGILKDLGLISATGQDAKTPLPVTEAVRDAFRAVREKGLGEANQTEILRIYE